MAKKFNSVMSENEINIIENISKKGKTPKDCVTIKKFIVETINDGNLMIGFDLSDFMTLFHNDGTISVWEASTDALDENRMEKLLDQLIQQCEVTSFHEMTLCIRCPKVNELTMSELSLLGDWFDKFDEGIQILWGFTHEELQDNPQLHAMALVQ